MRGLDRKLLRDVRTMRWQIASIALVVASGIQALLAPLGTYRSLERARARFYDETAFADVFVRLTRAPMQQPAIWPRSTALLRWRHGSRSMCRSTCPRYASRSRGG